MEERIMRKLFLAIISLFMMLSLTSCVTTVSAQDDMYVTERNVDFEIIIRDGTPYIIDGLVHYYFYNGLYYYPFYYNDYFYYRIYRRPLVYYPRHWHPIPRSHWYRDGKFHRPYRGNHFNNIRRPRVEKRDITTHRGLWSRPSSTRRTVQSPPQNNNNRNSTFERGNTTRPNGTMRPSPQPRISTSTRGGGRFGGTRR